MARILYWNINNFTNERIASVKRQKTNKDTDHDAGALGPQHLEMILDTLGSTVDPNTTNQVQLDFIVIVEVYGRNGSADEGELIEDSGKTGCINLLKAINEDVPGDWSMVPPVVSGADGAREAIAVYYRRDLWHFLGPETWPQAYTAEFAAGLPNRTIPAGYPYRANQPERRSAGQWQFDDAAPGGLVAPAQVNFPAANHRKPWLTAFGQVGHPNNLLRIMGIHTKPNKRGGQAFADQGTAALADVYDMTARPADAANQTDVIVGDFNVDNLAAASWQAGGPFARLIGVGAAPVAPAYSPLIRPPAALADEYQSYYHTHGRPSSDSPGEGVARITEEADPPDYWQRAGHYPGQEYTNLSIDNALVRYLGGANPPAGGHNMTILARARQQPYRAPAPPVAGLLRGHYQSVVYMSETIDAIYRGLDDDPESAETYDSNQYFRQWQNYGQIYSVSDHFALLFDV